jgi:hypothetical protein
MITIHKLMRYRKDELDYPVSLYTNGIGEIVDYEHDRPPLELLNIPKSIVQCLCPNFLLLVVQDNTEEIVLSEDNIALFRTELLKVAPNSILGIASNEMLKFVNRYESIKDRCHLAYQDRGS